MLILTACRRDEIGRLRWAEIDRDTSQIVLPGERTKRHPDQANEPRFVPVSSAAATVLASVPSFVSEHGKSPFAFTTEGDKPIAGWDYAKTRIDRIIAERRKAERREPMAGWRLHDFRRTVAHGLQVLGERTEIIEAVLGHLKPGSSHSKIVSVYQVHDYAGEAVTALERWGRQVTMLTTSRAAATAAAG